MNNVYVLHDDGCKQRYNIQYTIEPNRRLLYFTHPLTHLYTYINCVLSLIFLKLFYCYITPNKQNKNEQKRTKTKMQ